MDVADRLELHELPGRYGDAIDDRNWEGLGRIFTDDAVFDLTDLGGPRLEGLAHIRRFMDTEAEHPDTHLMTNIYVDEGADGTVTMSFRIVAMLKGRPPATGNYRDRVVKTPDGWRVQDRVFTVKRGPAAAERTRRKAQQQQQQQQQQQSQTGEGRP